MPPADLRLLLSHSPDLFYRAQDWDVDLMLAGHNHGGQIRLPLVGPVFMPSRYSRRFDRGFFRARPNVDVRQRGRGRKTPGSLRMPAGNQPVCAPRAIGPLGLDRQTAHRKARGNGARLVQG